MESIRGFFSWLSWFLSGEFDFLGWISPRDFLYLKLEALFQAVPVRVLYEQRAGKKFIIIMAGQPGPPCKGLIRNNYG